MSVLLLDGADGYVVGRYHRVAAAKKAKGYSSSDLAAILGVESMPAAVPAAVTAAPSTAQVCKRIRACTVTTSIAMHVDAPVVQHAGQHICECLLIKMSEECCCHALQGCMNALAQI